MVIAQATAAPVLRVAWLIPAFPLFGALVLLLFGKRLKRASGPIATTMMAGAFVVTVISYTQLSSLPSRARDAVYTLYSWIAAGSFRIRLDYHIDPMAIVMLLVVTGVGALIHLYSVGYMKGDENEGRYFAYLNLFAFSMLVLVMANNFLVLYVGWELVGLCSYLLIGFWFTVPENASAAKKAFITNRVGDFSFAIGIFLIFAKFGTLDFRGVFTAAPAVLSAGAATAIALLLFGGATGKSAQIPLYVWLPDAMAGPTPVSALIHAATMVTAGVYMVARTHAIFDLSHTAQNVVASIGVATALLAGLIAIVQDDIKRVLAYSTVSQLGYMFVGVGVGAYSAGIFHLVTHAFFKAALFLGAGSVMHAMGNRTDITKFGGLARKIPWTALVWVLAWLAIIGFPGTGGFFSKDQILEGAYTSGQTTIWILGLAGAAITGFYMTRVTVLTFFGRSRDDEGHHPHESPVSMVFPMLLLLVAAIVAGFVLGAHAENAPIHRFLLPVLGPHVVAAARSLSAGQLSVIATAAGLGGAAVALVMYSGAFDWARRRENPSLAWRAARNKFFVDDVYQFLFTSMGKLGASTLAFVVDTHWIDGVVNGLGTVTAKVAAAGRKVQTGLVRTYAVGIFGGGLALLIFFVWRARA